MRPTIELESVRSVVSRLFLGCDGVELRKEDEQKSREVLPLVQEVARARRGAHVVDAAAGKASVGLVAAELLPIGRVTVLERDPGRVAACRSAVTRMKRATPVDIKEADVGDARAWPVSPDIVVALHACGGATDLILDAAIASGARRVLLVPCCYGKSVPFREHATKVVARMPFMADDLLRRRMTTSLIDMERKLRLEAAGYQTDVEELMGPTVTPHNLVFRATRTCSDVRMSRARERMTALLAGSERDVVVG